MPMKKRFFYLLGLCALMLMTMGQASARGYGALNAGRMLDGPNGNSQYCLPPGFLCHEVP